RWLAGGAIGLGLLSTVVLAAPAYADSLTIQGTVVCAEGESRQSVQWSVFPTSTTTGVITARSVTPAESDMQGLDVGRTIGPTGRGPESGFQTVPLGTTEATIDVSVTFGTQTVTASGTVAVPATPCTRVPSATFTPAC